MVRVDHRLGNGQPKPETAEAARDGRLPLFERVKDFPDLVRFDPNPGIGDPNFNFVRSRARRRDRDLAVSGSEFHAVLDQIPKHLLQSRRVSFDMDALSVEIEFCFD